jgi:hypothetical protein
MKIATRIISGYGILIALVAGVLAYEVTAMHKMQSIGSTVARVNFQAAITSLQVMRDRDLVEEYAKKALLLGDQEYTEQLRGFTGDLNTSLEQIRSKPLSGREREEIERLWQFWNTFRETLAREQALGPATRSSFPPELQDALDSLRTQCYTVCWSRSPPRPSGRAKRGDGPSCCPGLPRSRRLWSARLSRFSSSVPFRSP